MCAKMCAITLKQPCYLTRQVHVSRRRALELADLAGDLHRLRLKKRVQNLDVFRNGKNFIFEAE